MDALLGRKDAMRILACVILISGMVGAALTFASVAGSIPDDDLRIVIIRHGEKPDTGDHLNCQGENRALLLPRILESKFGVPDRVYVPSLASGKSQAHARMFETVIPLVAKHQLKVNSEFDTDAAPAVADQLFHKRGTILVVWQHDAIPALASALGASNPPKWKKKDFDGIWIITYKSGQASLAFDRQGINPATTCAY